MLATCLLAFLALSSQCHGAALDKAKREAAIVEELDRSFDLFGVHIGVKYKDPTDRAQGGELILAVEDMKLFFPRARTKSIDVRLKFDGGASRADGLFDLEIHYTLNHAYNNWMKGPWVEEGSLNMFHHKEGNNWVSHLKTVSTGAHHGLDCIIPFMINNAQIDVVSDRETKFNLKYFNKGKIMNIENFEINVDRIPGAKAHVTVSQSYGPKVNNLLDLTFSATDLNLRKPDGNFDVALAGTVTGVQISGSVDGKKSDHGYRIKVDLSKGNRKFLQVDAKVKADLANMQFSTKTVYSFLGGVVQGTLQIKFENKEFTFMHINKDTKEKMEFRVYLDSGHKMEIEGKKNGESMWSYSTTRTTINDANTFDLNLETDMTLSSKSMLYTLMDRYYPYGAFNVRRNEVRVFVDKQNRNSLLPKFLVDVNLYKEGKKVVTLKVDSRTSPFTFLFIAPNVFDRWNINMDKIEGQMTHVPGNSIEIKTNLGGGIKINAQRGDNSKGGRDIQIRTEKAGKQMMKIDINTEKTVNDNEIKLKLHNSVEIDEDSVFYRKIVRNYRLLTPFRKRTGDFQIFLNRNEKSILLNKFYVKGEVKKDEQTVMKALMTTNEKPYKMSLYLPALLNKEEYEMTVDHNPGQHLKVDVNGRLFKGFKIVRTGSGNEVEIEINGRKLGSGDYTLTDNSFKTKISAADGYWIEPKITWQGRLPNNKQEAAAFFLTNSLTAEVQGSLGNFNADLDWTMDQPDLSTPWNCKMNFNIAGEGPNWGTYTFSRDVNAAVANKVISLTVNGDASFTKGVLAKISPVQTDVNLQYLMKDRDLVGKFSEVMKGKEYSVEFPAGSFVMPKITWYGSNIWTMQAAIFYVLTHY